MKVIHFKETTGFLDMKHTLLGIEKALIDLKN